MNRQNIIILIFILLSSAFFCSAQIKKEKVEFRGFPEGVYKNSKEFIARKPFIEKPEMLTGANKTPSSILSWVKHDSLYYKKREGLKTTISIDSVWAIYEGATLYVQLNRMVHKVNTFGMLCMFYENSPLVQAPFNPVASDQTRKSTPKMLDLETGEILPYNFKILKLFLEKHDELLFKQYSTLRTNKLRKKQLFHYIELYNEYHPVL